MLHGLVERILLFLTTEMDLVYMVSESMQDVPSSDGGTTEATFDGEPGFAC